MEDRKPPPYYRCKRCGSKDHYFWSQKCLAHGAVCGFCHLRGHLTELCLSKARREEEENRSERPSTSRGHQDQPASSKRKEKSSDSSSEAEVAAKKAKPSRELDASGSNVARDASSMPIPKEISMARYEKLHKCWIGRKSSQCIKSNSFQVNVVSSLLYEQLVASKEFACSGYDKVPGIVSEMPYEGVFAADIKTAAGNQQRAMFYIRKGTDEFVVVTKTLGDKLKIP